MISLEIIKILTHLQKLPKNVGDLGKQIVATGFEKLTKVQQIAQSGRTAFDSMSSDFSIFLVEMRWKENDIQFL